jgi:hypothetical protein
VLTAVRTGFSSGATLTFPNDTEVTLEKKTKMGFSKNSRFQWQGEGFVWRSTKKCVRDDGLVMARFERKWVGKGDGGLVVYLEGEGMIDVLVGTFMMVWYRRLDEERGH